MTEKDLDLINSLPDFQGPNVVMEALKRKRQKMMLDRGIPVGKSINEDQNATTINPQGGRNGSR